VAVAGEEIEKAFADIVDATHFKTVQSPVGAKSPSGLLFSGAI
jgi:hypothetical protein